MNKRLPKNVHLSQTHFYRFPGGDLRKKKWPTDKLTIHWGNTRQGTTLDRLGASHFLLMGATRYGKTTLLHLLMKSVLCTGNLEYPLRYRALINDPKQEWYKLLRRWALEDQHIIVANPFDKRSSAWDLAADLTSPTRVADFVEDLCEAFSAGSEQQRHQESVFWRNIAKETLNAIVAAFQEVSPNDWDLRDLVCCALDADAREQALNITPIGRGIWSDYFSLEGTHSQIPGGAKATLRNVLQQYAPTAALWHRAKSKFTFKDWKRRGAIILLGYNREAEQHTQPTNYLLLKAAAQRVLNSADTQEDLSWFCLDEIASIGATPKLIELLNMGASRGARVAITALGFGNLKSAFPNSIESEEIIASTTNKALVRLEHHDDRRIAKEQLGSFWTKAITQNQTSDPDGYNSWSFSDVERFRFEIEDLLGQERPENGIDAIVQTAGQIPW